MQIRSRSLASILAATITLAVTGFRAPSGERCLATSISGRISTQHQGALTRTVNRSAAGFTAPGVDDIQAIAVDPSNPDVIYLGTYHAGVWKSIDGGSTWAAANNGISPHNTFALTVYCLAIDPSDPQIIYAGTGPPAYPDWAPGVGIYKTVNGGQSWLLVKSIPGADPVETLAIDPSNPNVVYAGICSEGLAKTTDGGKKWEAVNSGLKRFITGFELTGLAIDPANPSTIYFGCENGLFKTENGGAKWHATSFPVNVDSLALDPKLGTIYAAGMALNPDPPFEIVYTSNDGGVTWSSAPTAFDNAVLIRSLVVDPTSPGTAYAGDEGSGIYQTTNGGESWSVVDAGLSNPTVEVLAICPSNSTTIFAGTTCGLFESSNAAAEWAALHGNLPPATISSLAIDPTNANVIYAATGTTLIGTDQPLVYYSTDGGSSWTAGNLGPAVQSFGQTPIIIYTIAVDPTHPSNVYIGTDLGPAKSTDGGATWYSINSSPRDSDILDVTYGLVFEPSGTLLAGAYHGLFETTDGGATWVESDTGLPSAQPPPVTPRVCFISSVALDPSDPQTLYAASDVDNGVYKSTDAGASWSRTGPGSPKGGGIINNGLAINPADDQTILAATGVALFESTVVGGDWVRLHLRVSHQNISALVIDPQASNVIYVATNAGVVRSVDGGKTWNTLSLPFISPTVSALAIDSSGTVYVGSQSGLFRLTNPMPDAN